MDRSGGQGLRSRRRDEESRQTAGAHRMGWGHRLVSRLGFGSGAVATTVMIAGSFAIINGDVNIATLTGSSQGNALAAIEPSSSLPVSTADAGTVGNDIATDPRISGPTAAAGSDTTTSALAPSTTSPTSASRSASTHPTVSAPTTSTIETADLAEQVLDQMNQARTAAGLPLLVMSQGLVKSAAAHNKVMSSGCGLSHQCTGESDLGKRITAQGVTWTAAGENIGQGGPEPDSGDAIVAMAKQLTADMLAETPPEDEGHKKNILSKSFRHVGISLYRDANGTVWMTQDFAS